MKHIAVLLLVLLALVLFSEKEISHLYERPTPNAPIAIIQTKQMKGLYLDAGKTADFPSQPNLHKDQMVREAQEIIAAAKENGMNSIFYQVRPEGNALYSSNYFERSSLWVTGNGYSQADPLKVLCVQAAKEGLPVFVVVDLFSSNKEAVKKWPQRTYIQTEDTVYLDPSSESTLSMLPATMDELTKKYDISGIILMDRSQELKEMPFYFDNLEAIVQESTEAVKMLDRDMLIGFACDVSLSAPGEREAMETMSSKGEVDFFVPIMDSSRSTIDGSYQADLSSFISSIESIDVPIIPANMVNETEPPHNLSYQLFVNHQLKLEGGIVGRYSELVGNTDSFIKEAGFMFKNLYHQNLDTLNIRLSKNLSVTYPEDGAVISGGWCYITGLSNPKEELTINGVTVENRGENGSFGVLQRLKPGENTFEFEQPSRFASITVESIEADAETGILPTDKIVPDSAFPKEDTPIRNDSSVRLSCIAPSGSEVTARLGENIYTLHPKTTYVQEGVPVLYSTDIVLKNSNLKQTETNRLGMVTYSLTYNGLVTNQKSQGILYLTGNKSKLAVEVKKYSANVLKEPRDGAAFVSTFKTGTRDFVVNILEDYYQLKSGGYIAKEDVSIVTGNADVEQNIENVILQADENEEKLVFIGGNHLPYHFSGENLSNDSEHREVSFTVYYGEKMPDILAHLKSDMFKRISIKKYKKDNKAVITMKLKKDTVLWGYDVFYENGNLVLQLKKAPPKSKDPSLPLAGIKILLDPGHGGTDTGSMGVAGQAGPEEKELTLMTAKMLKNRLEFYGAEVYLTRVDDSTLMKGKRLQLVSSFNADLVLSLHYTKTSEQEDGTKVHGVQASYSNIFSRDLAALLANNLSEDLGRFNRGAAQFYTDGIIETTLSPTVYLGLGYLSNPKEYEKSCNALEMYQTICSISDSIIYYMDSIHNTKNTP